MIYRNQNPISNRISTKTINNIVIKLITVLLLQLNNLHSN